MLYCGTPIVSLDNCVAEGGSGSESGMKRKRRLRSGTWEHWLIEEERKKNCQLLHCRTRTQLPPKAELKQMTFPSLPRIAHAPTKHLGGRLSSSALANSEFTLSLCIMTMAPPSMPGLKPYKDALATQRDCYDICTKWTSNENSSQLVGANSVFQSEQSKKTKKQQVRAFFLFVNYCD